MKNKQFFFLFCGVVGILALLLSVFNYVIDYYSVFSGAKREVIISNQINDRFVKMQYLLENHHFEKYDSYLWGSSRVMKTDPQVTGKKTYNLGASLGMPEDCLRDLKQLKANGAPINTVYLGLDDFSYSGDYEELASVIYRRPYEEQISKRYSYYAELLMTYGVVKTWIKENKDHPKGTIMLGQTGTYLIPQEEEMKIEENPGAYIREEKFRKTIMAGSGRDSRLNRCLEVIREIKQFCDENHIRFIPFFNPQHMTNYQKDDLGRMNRFKKELAKISPFWDFSGVNVITSNNYFWYETSHPRAFICDKILDTVSEQNQMTWVPNFGVYVTEETVNAFCEKALHDRNAYDPNHEQWIPSEEERAMMTRRINYSW